MNLFQRIFGRPAPPAWEISPGAIVWKLQPAAGGILMGESRDVERKRMTLFAINPSDGTLLYSGAELHEPWWIALEMTAGEIAILHEFPRPDLPAAMGITAVDSRTGEMLWRNPGMRGICGTGEILLVRRNGPSGQDVLAFVDARTGAILEEIGGENGKALAFKDVCAGSGIWSGWVNANPLDEDHPRSSQINELLARLLKEPRGGAEIADYAEFTVVGAYARSRISAEAMLAGHLEEHLILLRDGRPIVHEILSTDTAGPGSDMFFIWNGVLIFIRNRRTLAGINLNTA